VAPVAADLNEISTDYKKHIEKFLPTLRQPSFGLSRAADYLQAYVEKRLERHPLLDVSKFLVKKKIIHLPHEMNASQRWIGPRLRLRRSLDTDPFPADVFARMLLLFRSFLIGQFLFALVS